MATATIAESPQRQGSPPPLWGDIEIPIIVGTGEFGQGKTLFGLTICPGPETLVYDYEGSSLTYRSIGFHHVDMAAELLAKYPNGFTSEQRYLWWREDIVRRAKSGKYRVGVIDPASEIEDGMADHLRKNITKYGLTQAQCDRSPALFWGVMKKEWKLLLDQLRNYFDTLYMTVHLRDEFKGGAPTGKREPKGKETLFELASLFLWFEREKNKKTGEVAAVPSATVLKSRLAKTIFVNDELQVVPVLPPRLPRATPKAIREYIATPPDYDKLAKAERIHEKELTEDERLLLQSQMAANQALAAQAELSLEEKRAQAAERMRNRPLPTPSPDQSAEFAQRQTEKAEAAAVEHDNQPAEPTEPTVSESLATEIRQLLADAFATREEAKEWVTTKLAAVGADRITSLSQSAAESMRAELFYLKSVELQRRAAEKLAGSGTVPTTDHEPSAKEAASVHAAPPDAAPQGTLSTAPGTATKDQLAAVAKLADSLGWEYDKQTQWLEIKGHKSFKNCSAAELADLIDKLEKRHAAKN